jgi:F0F1-type ATP synthase epsilon subunit
MYWLLSELFEIVKKEIIVSTNSGQIGVKPNHTPINTVVDMGS